MGAGAGDIRNGTPMGGIAAKQSKNIQEEYMEQEYKWVTNMPDEGLLEQGKFQEYMDSHPEQVQYLAWYQECRFGDPNPGKYSVEYLKKMGYVGAYRKNA